MKAKENHSLVPKKLYMHSKRCGDSFRVVIHNFAFVSVSLSSCHEK